jgi:hypothetical protein
MTHVSRSLVVGLIGWAALSSGEGKVRAESPDVPTPVSLVQLIATPERFDGKLVGLVGFCHLEFEGDAIYLHREDFDALLTRNAVAIDLPSSVPPEFQGLSGKYVIVEGRFRAPGPGIVTHWCGRLEAVQRLERSPSRTELERVRTKDHESARERKRIPMP